MQPGWFIETASPSPARRHALSRCGLLLGLAFALPVTHPALAQQSTGEPAGPAPAAQRSDPIYIPDVSRFLPRADNAESLSASLQILVLLTLLTLAPSILLMMTSFVRMLIVLVLLRQALGTQQLPPSQVLIGLALFMTLLAMAPVWNQIHASAIEPYVEGRMGQLEAIGVAGRHLREFMFDQIEAAGNEQDVYMFYEYAAGRAVPPGQTIVRSDVPMRALIPAFVLSELKVAFLIGFRIYLPFLVIDMVIATVLVSMGMMMLPPVLISLPFKLLLFVLADGWHLVAGALLNSVQ